MYDFQTTLDEMRRRKRRRRIVIASGVAVIVLFASVLAVASLDYPELTIRSMSVEQIDIPADTLYIGMYLAVHNTNNVDATISSVEGKVSSAGKKLDTFAFEEATIIPAKTNLTVTYTVRVMDVPLPLPDPVLVVEGSAKVRAFARGITYHFTHQIPLTHSPDMDNQPPVADISGPRYIRRDKPASFDGTNSYDPDGKVVGYAWDFGDGYHMTGAEVEHSFLNPGVHTITLTVIDQAGERGKTSTEIRVLPV
ncbi:MAG: PKD domain-containing protein [Thermoplasmata archaeon]|nr:MAG: PKD domain-containing protein [Thermoplasmata archaeon]